MFRTFSSILGRQKCNVHALEKPPTVVLKAFFRLGRDVCPPLWSCLSLVSGLVSHLVGDAVTASPVLSPVLSPISGLGSCVRLAGPVSSLVSHLSRELAKL